MAVSVTFGAKDAGLDAMNQKVAASAAKMTNEYKAAARESRLQEAAGLRALKTQETASQKYAQTLRGLRQLVNQGRISQEQATAAARAYRLELETTGRPLAEFGNRLRNMVSGYLGIASAIGVARTAYQSFLQNLREHQKLTREILDSSLDFALLQPPELVAQRRRQVAALGVREGAFRTEEERAQLFDLVQAMQSATGSFEEGMRLSAAVLAASKVAIPVPLGKEAATQAFLQGQDPRQYLRQIFVAGQLGKRTPEDIAKAIPAIQLLDDKAFAFAMANVLTDQFKDSADTFITNAAKALAKDANRRKLGVPKTAPAEEVLEALSKAGITPGEAALRELPKFGISDVRAIKGINVLLQNMEEVRRQKAEIQRLAVPGLIQGERARLEAGDPAFAARRRLAQQESEFQARRAFDEEAMAEEERGRAAGLRHLRRGRETAFGIDVAGEAGDVHPLMRFLVDAAEGLRMALAPGTAVGLPVTSREARERDKEMVEAMQRTNTILETRLPAPGTAPSKPETGRGD